MARSVPLWLWRKCLRDHGPRDPMMLLALHVVGTFFNEKEGESRPSQEGIARAACMSVRSVRDKLHDASCEHWIGIYAGMASGQKWARFSYRLCIPDRIELDEDDAKLADAFQAIHGDVDGAALTGGPFSKKKGPAPPAAPSLSTHGRSGNSRTKDRQLAQEGAATGAERTGTTCRQSSSLKVLQESSSREGAALTLCTVSSSLSKKQEPEVLHGVGALLQPPAKPTPQRLTDAERIRKAAKLLAVDPRADVVRLYQLTPGELQKARSA